VRFGSLRRLRPVGEAFGKFRGTTIGRHYIEEFLQRHSGRPGYVVGDIRGQVLEVGDDMYARRFGTLDESSRPPETAAKEGYVTSIDVLHVDDSNPVATIVGDLADGEGLPADAFDCVICIQTLLLIYDVRAAIRTLHQLLKPGGVVLVCVPGISQLLRPDYDLWGDYWRFTSLSIRRLFEEVFPAQNVRVEAQGNVLTAIGRLHGLAAEDLHPEELDLHDPDYEVNIAVRAVKSG